MATARFGLARPHLAWWTGRAGLLVVIVLAGYWLSLASLVRGIGGQTPLAFVGLAPVLALGLLVAGLGRREPLPMPGRIDLLVGLALIAAAAAIVLLGPFLASIYFWVARLDMVSLPLFVGGSLILLFGWRVLFVARGALMLLLLAWPLPYLVIIENTSELLTKATAGALAAVTSVIPMATAEPGGNAYFTIAYAPHPFRVQVSTACAGLNSTVAFLLVGGAFAMLLSGRVLAKVAWLAVGLVVVFLFNVLRVILLVAVGAAFGQEAALDLFHPVAGMLALLGALVLMLTLVSRFGLRMPSFRPDAPKAAIATKRTNAPSRHDLKLRGALLLVVAVFFGGVNATFAAYDRGPAESSVVAKPLAAAPPMIGDRIVSGRREVIAGKPYYGEDSTWVRYSLRRDAAAAKEDQYRLWLDDIRVSDRQALVDFGVEKCYRFHGYSIDASEPVALGDGVVARIITTRFSPGGIEWVVLWWEWPIEVGASTLHQRLVLLAPATTPPSTAQPAVQERPLVMFNFGNAVPARFRPLASDMASLATQIVASQSGGIVQ